MNLAEARIALRPRSMGETLDLALRWQATVGGGLYVRLWCLTMLPAALGCYALVAVADAGWWWAWLAAIALATVLQGVFTVAASRLMFEGEVGTLSVLGQFGRRLPVYLVSLILTRLYLAAAGLIVILAPWAWAHGAFVHEAVLLEGQGSFAAVKRSGGFAAGQYGTVITMLLAFGVAVFGFVAGGDQVGYAVFDFLLQLGRPFGTLWEDGGSLMALLGFFASVPYTASVRFLQYIDARTRRDGWDIQLAFLARVLADQESVTEGEAA